jgi:NAD(P)-dependent dehydrogenase (short-subunit alcohol dehydrogenase family)
VNNAASGALLPLGELDESHWQRALDTNLRGSLWCARRAAPLLASWPGAAIVNLSSLGSSLVISDYATVGTSKAAVEALTRYLAVEFAANSIRVNIASGGLLASAVATMFPNATALRQTVTIADSGGHPAVDLANHSFSR